MSKINEKLATASTCPFCNMVRAFQGLTCNPEGNVERVKLRERMVVNGFGPLSSTIIDRVTALFEKGQVKEGWFNLTTIFNKTKMNHFADMGAVDAEKGKVDAAKVARVVELIDEYGDGGVADILTMAKLQRVLFARDEKEIFKFKIKPEQGSGIKGFIRESLSVFGRFFYAKVVSPGELALIMLMLGHRDRATRIRLFHAQEMRAFLADGEKPEGWQKEVCNLVGVGALVVFMWLLQTVLLVPGGGFFAKLLMMGYNIYCAILNRFKYLIMAPFGHWTVANLISRSELKARYS